MTDGKILAQTLFKNLINLPATRVKLGYGTFITMDFGKDIPEEIKTRQGTEIAYFGQWHLWIYMCAWRIDIHSVPYIGSEDDLDLIREKFPNLSGKKLLKFSILNDAFDAYLQFEEGFEIRLFSNKVIENEQWMLYTPEQKVFTAGPGNSWSYENDS